MTSWPIAGQMLSYTDATTGATPLAIMKTAIKTGDSSVLNQLPDSLSLLFGATGDGFGAGTTGEVCAIALLLGLAYMLWKKVITWHIPVSIIATVFVFSGLMHLANCPPLGFPLGLRRDFVLRCSREAILSWEA